MTVILLKGGGASIHSKSRSPQVNVLPYNLYLRSSLKSKLLRFRGIVFCCLEAMNELQDELALVGTCNNLTNYLNLVENNLI